MIATWLAVIKLTESRPRVNVGPPEKIIGDRMGEALVRVFNPGQHPILIHRARRLWGSKFILTPPRGTVRDAIVHALHPDDLNVVIASGGAADFELHLDDETRSVLMLLTWSSNAGLALPSRPLVIWQSATKLKRLQRALQRGSSE